MSRKEKIVMLCAVMLSAIAGSMHYAHANAVLTFIISSGALAVLAMIVGDATEQLGRNFGPGVTGILQSALGNLTELFVCIFALRAGLDKVVQAALVGSILGNALLVLGLAIFVGGLKNGRQKFKSDGPKMITTLMIIAFAALAIPTLTKMYHTRAERHLNTLDVFLAVVLLVMFAGSLFFSLRNDASAALESKENKKDGKGWTVMVTIAVLALAGGASAFVSDWFIDALTPAMAAGGINDTFAGLIIVALAGNAIENVVGIQLAYKNKMDYSISVIMNSSLQIALFLFPLLVLLSFILGGAILSFILSPMLLASLALCVIVCVFIVFDGESIWMEGVSLIGLYLLIAAAFWWG